MFIFILMLMLGKHGLNCVSVLTRHQFRTISICQVEIEIVHLDSAAVLGKKQQDNNDMLDKLSTKLKKLFPMKTWLRRSQLKKFRL